MGNKGKVYNTPHGKVRVIVVNGVRITQDLKGNVLRVNAK